MIRKLLICSAYKVCSHMLEVHKYSKAPMLTHSQTAKLPLEVEGKHSGPLKIFKVLLKTESLPKHANKGAL